MTKRDDRMVGLDEAAIRATRERLLYLHCDYAYFMSSGAEDISTTGMTASYARVTSGRTNRTSDLTACSAIRLANLSPGKKLSLRWVDCAWRVYVRGTSPVLAMHNYTLNERRVLATISYVLYYKAFLGYTLDCIAAHGLFKRGPVSKQRIYEFWNRAVIEVAKEARKEGLV